MRPVCAMTTARFDAVMVLPSPGAALVTSSVCSGVSTDANSMFARRVRYASAALGPWIQETGKLIHLAPTVCALHPHDAAQGAQAGDLLDRVRVLDRVVQLLHDKRDARDNQ